MKNASFPKTLPEYLSEVLKISYSLFRVDIYPLALKCSGVRGFLNNFRGVFQVFSFDRRRGSSIDISSPFLATSVSFEILSTPQSGEVMALNFSVMGYPPVQFQQGE